MTNSKHLKSRTPGIASISGRRLVSHLVAGAGGAASTTFVVLWVYRQELNWNAVAAIAGAIAALAAAAAVIITMLVELDRRNAARSEWERSYYHRFVTVPLVDAIEAYRKSVRELLKHGIANIQAMCIANTSHSAVLASIAALINDCNEQYYTLVQAIMVGTEAWADRDLGTVLRERADLLQDELNLAIELLGSGSPKPDFEGILSRKLGKLLGEVMKSDPGSNE